MIRMVLVLLALATAGAIGAAVVYKSFLSTRPSADGGTAVFEIKPGQSLKAVSMDLEKAGLVENGTKFYWFARLNKAQTRIRVGEYAIARDANPAEVLRIITSGKSIERKITVTEGFNIYEIGEQIEREGMATRQEFLDLVRDRAVIRELLGADVTSLEGYLFPETYNITKYTTINALVKMMVTRFLAVYKELPEHKMSRHELVTLASIIEKETGAPEERPMISSVFHNRLAKGMRLQTDPTVIYGIFHLTGQWNKNISKADLLRDHAYNTYTRGGLPAGPISSPGKEALVAATRPAQTEFLFFVSRNDGTHVFSKDYKAHQNAVTQFQLDRKAREGKSWRDLKKRQQAPEKVRATGG